MCALSELQHPPWPPPETTTTTISTSTKRRTPALSPQPATPPSSSSVSFASPPSYSLFLSPDPPSKPLLKTTRTSNSKRTTVRERRSHTDRAITPMERGSTIRRTDPHDTMTLARKFSRDGIAFRLINPTV
ncbi:hypothetical protein L1049_028196 [Liquidambar formosana]|uniref:Uncharacterized protein n=1 Tax=Liquidambar formosana TaxID=63359 RepID=A0AAP0RK07_LIQFO